jgi:MarR family transcriptional regulator
MEFKTYLKINLEYNKIERAIKRELSISFNEVVILDAIVKSQQKELSLDFLKDLIGVSYGLIHKYIKNLEAVSLISKYKNQQDGRKWMINVDETQLNECQNLLEKVKDVYQRFN